MIKKVFTLVAALALVASIAIAGVTNYDTVDCSVALNAPTITATTSLVGGKVMLPYILTNAMTSETVSVLYIAGENASSVYKAPFAGSVVGIGVQMNSPHTTGSMTFYVNIDGVQSAFGTSLTTTEVSAYNTANISTYSFSAGSTIEAVYQTGDVLAPATVDGSISVQITQ